MKKGKVLASIGLGALCLASLVSCKDDQYINVYSSAGDDLAPIIDGVISEFNEKSGSKFKIKLVNPGGGYDGLKTAITGDIQAGSLPGLSFCYADHVAEYLTADVVLDMNQFINDPELGFTAEEKADFIPGYYNEGWQAFGGQSASDFMYTLPLSKSTEVMYYNKTVLEDLGIDYSDINNWTWDHFWDVCNQIKKSKYSSWTPVGIDSEDNLMITLDKQYGIDYTSATGDHYLFNNQENIDLINKLNGLFKNGIFTTKTINGGKFSSELFTVKRDPENQLQLTEGDKVSKVISCVFSIGSTAGARKQSPKNRDFEVGIARLPQADPKNPMSINQGPSLVMFDLGDDEVAQEKERITWLFTKELLGTKFQSTYSKVSGYIPVRLSVQEETEYSSWLADESNIIAQTVKFALSNSKAYFVSPAFNGSNKARTEIGSALVQVLSEKKTAEKALSDAEKSCEF